MSYFGYKGNLELKKMSLLCPFSFIVLWLLKGAFQNFQRNQIFVSFVGKGV